MPLQLLDFYGYVAFVVIAFAFFILISLGASSNFYVGSRAGYADTSLVLLNILKTPVKSNNNIADLVVQSSVTKDFKDFERLAMPLIIGHFNSNYETMCWELRILKSGAELFKYIPANCQTTKENVVEKVVQLPGQSYKDFPVDVVLNLYVTQKKPTWVNQFR